MGGKDIAARAILAGALVLPGVMAFGADYPPGDHANQPLILADGDRIWGLHTGISHFEIPTSMTATVKAFDGVTTSGTGMVEIYARTIRIAGILDANGAGYTGGGGGGGGGGGNDFPNPYFFGTVGGEGGQAAYGAGAFDGQNGGNSVGIPEIPGMASPGMGGKGGAGDGSFGGLPDGPIDGGYAAPEANGDVTTDTTTRMGSGGGGGNGYSGEAIVPTGGPGGGAGGSGGGTVRFHAKSEFVLEAGSRISADGVWGGNGEVFGGADGGDGGSPQLHEQSQGGINQAVGPGWPGMNGGRGAGGGILIDVSETLTVHLDPGAEITSLGAAQTESLGGTVKVFYFLSDPTSSGVSIHAGRVFRSAALPSSLWMFR